MKLQYPLAALMWLPVMVAVACTLAMHHHAVQVFWRRVTDWWYSVPTYMF